MGSFIYLLKSTAILSLFILVYEFFLRKETLYAYHRIFLLLGIFIAAVLPYFSIEKRVVITQYVEAATTPTHVAHTLASYDILNEIPEKISFLESLSYVQILFGIYLLVVVFFLVKFLFSLWQLSCFLKKEKVCTAKNGINYIQTKENTGPFSFLNYIVYNPYLHKDGELKLILKHEEAHVKNYHSVDVLLANVLVFTNWFNPLAWLYRKRISQNLEFLADAEATQNLDCSKAYQLSLLNYVKIDSSHLPVNNFHKSFINTRIRKLHQTKSNKNASLKAGIILPMLTAFFLVFQVNSQEEIRYAKVDTTPEILENEINLENTPIAILAEDTEEIDREIPLNKSDVSTETNAEKQPNITIASKVAVSATIVKTTTEVGLKAIKKNLKLQQIDFEYSSLKYDKQNNLTQIVMSFKDKDGEGYHYSILGSKPIPEIQLVISEDFTGFRTFTNTDQTLSIDRNSAIILNGKPSSNFDNELREILIATKERARKNQEAILEHHENDVNTVSYIKSINIIKNTTTAKDSSAFIIINDENQMDNLRQAVTNKVALIENKRDSLVLIRKGIRLADQTKEESSYDAIVFMIEKHTSDQEFEDIKNFFASHNIDFTSSVKRNKKGEITKVKVKSNDQNGKRSTTSYENNQGVSGFRLGLKGTDFFVD